MVAQRYIDLVHARNAAGVAALYADDGIVAHANPRTDPAVVQGRTALEMFYRHVADSRSVMSGFVFMTDGPTCVFQFEGRTTTDDTPNEMIDIFQVNPDGLVRRMDAYTRRRDGVRGIAI